MLKIERRRTANSLSVILVSVAAVFLSLLVSILVLQIAGYDALNIILKTFKETYFTKGGILSLLVYVSSFSLCAMAVVVAAKAGLWNVGVEGQFLVGASVAAGLGIAFPNLPWFIMIPIIFIASMAAAGLYCYVSVLPRIYFGINEILTTVLLNSVAGYWIGYLSNLAWRDTTSTSPQSITIFANSVIPRIPNAGRLHWGFVIGILAIIAVWFLLRNSVFGYEMRAVGLSTPSARYSGINIKKIFFIAMFVSGCLAGMAGFLEVCGVSHRIRPQLASDYGLSGFVIAWVSRLNPLVVLVVSYLFAGFTVVGFKLQMAGFQSSIVQIIKGLILFFILAGEIFTFYKISWVPKGTKDDDDAQEADFLDDDAPNTGLIWMIKDLFTPLGKKAKKEEGKQGGGD